MKIELKNLLAMATLGILIFTSNSTTMASPVLNNLQQPEAQNLSAWPRIRDGIISNLIGGSENNNNDSYDEDYYNPPNHYNPLPPRPVFPPPPPPRPHRPHHPHHPHHYY
jgi:hypothetical protein